MVGAALLAAAIVVEVAATLLLRASDGFSRLLPTVGVVLGYVVAFVLLGFTLKSIPVSVAYAIWAGIGTAAIGFIGIVALGEPAGAIKIASLAAIIAGVVGLQLAGGAH